MDRSLSLIFGHSNCDDLSRLGSSSAHSANRGQRQNWTKPASDTWGAHMANTIWSFAPVFPVEMSPRDYGDRC